MRNRIVFPLTLTLAFAPVLALAQEDEGAEEAAEDEGGGETEGQEVVPPRPGVTTGPMAGGRETAPGEVHTVNKGDTLWDLSQRYLGNAWYWPKVWSYNPEIANPHWIYPGNRVRFFPEGGDEGPTRAETGEGPGTQGGSEIDEVEPSTAFVSDEPDDTIQVQGKIGPTLPNSTTVVRDSFMTAREVEEAGVIDSAFTEALMLSSQMDMYVRFKQASGRIGDRYLIFRTEMEVKNPRSGARAGYLTRILGTARIIKVNDKFSTMRIDESWDEIRRSDLIGPYGERLTERIAPRLADRRMEGIVLGAANPHVTFTAEYHSVIIDKGSADGVQPGFEFIIQRRGDFGGRFNNPVDNMGRGDLPWEDIGICMAVDVKETASTCLLRRSLREIYPGDRIETRPAGEAVSAR